MKLYYIEIRNTAEWETDITIPVGVYDEDHIEEGLNLAFVKCEDKLQIKRRKFIEKSTKDYPKILFDFYNDGWGDTSISAVEIEINKGF